MKGLTEAQMRGYEGRITKRVESVARSAGAIQAKTKPSDIMRQAGLVPDNWQVDLLDTEWDSALLLIHRQGGKSTTTAALGLDVAISRPNSTVLITAPSQRQARQLFDKIKNFYISIGSPYETEYDSVTMLKLTNGSVVHSLHGSEKTLRGISAVDLLIVDEASLVDDALFSALSPMLAVSGGRQIWLSTPRGKRGSFYREWIGGGDWKRIKITADKCKRIRAEFLARERARMGESMYLQEYFCEFVETLDAVFSDDDIQRAMNTEEQAWNLLGCFE